MLLTRIPLPGGQFFTLLAGSLASLLAAGCRPTQPIADHGLLTMIDCQFETHGAVHLHVSEQRGTASVVSDYQPAAAGKHADALRQGRESKGTLAPPGGSRYRIEVFLRNDAFGSRPEEVLTLVLESDGRARFEGQAPGAALRVLDRGTCINAH
ncbi:MAG: hypothetical protein VKM34_00600 [Cyanobacteriota bacterium]|nr:hypothetical protein [Cyanobacteriota bacterium]